MWETITAVSAGLGYFSGKEAAERDNKAAQARIVALEETKKAERRLFEYQTMSKYYGEDSAGAARIARSAMSGTRGGQTAGLLNILGQAAVSRDAFLESEGQKARMRQIDLEISSLKGGRTDPGVAGLLGGFASGASAFAATFDFSKTEDKDKGKS